MFGSSCNISLLFLATESIEQVKSKLCRQNGNKCRPKSYAMMQFNNNKAGEFFALSFNNKTKLINEGFISNSLIYFLTIFNMCLCCVIMT